MGRRSPKFKDMARSPKVLMCAPLAAYNVPCVPVIGSKGRGGTTETSAPVSIRKWSPDVLSVKKSQRE